MEGYEGEVTTAMRPTTTFAGMCLAMCVAQLLVVGLSAQTGTRRFDVASIRPEAPGVVTYGMTITSTRVDVRAFTLTDLLTAAFRVRPDQIVGPEWLAAQRFDVHATIPNGATREHVPEMLENLLTDRFGLRTHRESREASVYALVVSNKGQKLRPSPPDADATSLDTRRLNITQNGWEMSRVSMQALGDLLTEYVERPVVDATGLVGTYDFVLPLSEADLAKSRLRVSADAAGPSDPAGGSVIRAVESLGLKLESRRMRIPVVVIDAINRNPTDN
jgi:uncharacterized protein (TIGR03435 family)